MANILILSIFIVNSYFVLYTAEYRSEYNSAVFVSSVE